MSEPHQIVVPGFKIFEVGYDDKPWSLVHGMPTECGKRSRRFKMETWLKAEDGKPGFNLFINTQDLISYLPRFRVRYPRLAVCRVMARSVAPIATPNYTRFDELYISYVQWMYRLTGEEVMAVNSADDVDELLTYGRLLESV